MSNVTRKHHESEEQASSGMSGHALGVALAGPGTWLAPAEAIRVELPFVIVVRDGRELAARLAMAVAYEPAIGDQLLVIGDGSQAFVIGVISGSGATRLALEGDVEVAASGTLSLSGGAGVRVTAPDLELRADRMSMIAGRVTKAFHSVRQTVRELLSVHAGEQHTLVDGTSHLQAKSTRVLSEKKVTINGREIFLG